MAVQILNNGISGQAFREILNTNFADLESNKAIKNHASSSSEFGIGSTTTYGHVKVNNGNGLAINNGIVSMSQGTSTQPGALRLIDSTESSDIGAAVSAHALKLVAQAAIKVYTGTGNPSADLGKNGDIYIKTA